MKLIKLVTVILCSVVLIACSNTEEGKKAKESITIQTLNANKEMVSLEVPYDPDKIAVLDMAALDILDSLGLQERIVGTATTSLSYLQSYETREDVVNLGTIKEVDLEAVMKVAPDIIFIGGRLAASYDQLSEIAPVVYLATDTQLGVVNSVERNATTIASIFGKEMIIEEKMSGVTDRINQLKEKAEGQQALIGMTTSGSFNLLGNDGRCSLIGNEIGFTNLSEQITKTETSTHGNEASFELIVELNPDYLFVMDRDAAIQSEGATLAKEIVENELVKQTFAYQNNRIIYLSHPSVWYTAEGGITALDIMLQDIESAFQ